MVSYFKDEVCREKYVKANTDKVMKSNREQESPFVKSKYRIELHNLFDHEPNVTHYEQTTL